MSLTVPDQRRTAHAIKLAQIAQTYLRALLRIRDTNPGPLSMPTAAVALRAAIHDALAADTPLTNLLGGAKIYDEVPRAVAFPYVTLGEARISDWSTASESGEEHQLTLHAWSRQGGHREAHMIAGALLQALDDAPLTLAEHRLVNLRFATADIRREADGRTYRAVVRFRAVTEPSS
ncbi:MAG: hypothetical protein QOF19_855 [Alphaproteobacteria bacterium]|nr:hypothetical protein [Alphaproteobacteria bacterium]